MLLLWLYISIYKLLISSLVYCRCFKTHPKIDLYIIILMNWYPFSVSFQKVLLQLTLLFRAEFRALFLILIFPESNQSSNSVKLVSSALLTSLLNAHPCCWSRNHSVLPHAFAHAVVSVLQTIVMSPSDLNSPWEISINH